jgi:hypothetical protein
VGGNLTDNLKVDLGLKTLPAVFASGKPDAPTTDNVGYQPLLSKAVKGLLVILTAPSTNGKLFITSFPFNLATSYNY